MKDVFPSSAAKAGMDTLLRLVAASVAALTLLLTLIGFGFDYAYLDNFGLTPMVVKHGPVDFLMQSGQGLMSLVELSKRMEAALSWDGMVSAWHEFAVIAYTVPAVLLALFYVAIRLLPIMAASSWGQTINTKAAKALRWLDKDRRLIFGAPLVGFVGVPVLWLVGHFILWALIFLIVMPAVGIPLISAADGQKYARDTVVAPSHCRPLDARGHQPGSTRGARCVRVMKSGEEIQRGRYIVENEHRVWLLRMVPWAVVSVPLDDAVMEDVQDEAPASSMSSKR